MAFELTAVVPVGQDLDQFAQRITAWLRAHGYPVDNFVIGDVPDYVAAGGLSMDGIVELSPGAAQQVRLAAARMGRRSTSVGPEALYGLALMIHEALHNISASRWASRYSTTEHQEWEEGAVEAVARDLLPGAAKKLWGANVMMDWTGAGYDNLVARVRTWSSAATHSPWRSSAARAWRGAFLRADIETRKQMVAEANEAKKTYKAWWGDTLTPAGLTSWSIVATLTSRTEGHPSLARQWRIRYRRAGRPERIEMMRLAEQNRRRLGVRWRP